MVRTSLVENDEVWKEQVKSGGRKVKQMQPIHVRVAFGGLVLVRIGPIKH